MVTLGTTTPWASTARTDQSLANSALLIVSMILLPVPSDRNSACPPTVSWVVAVMAGAEPCTVAVITTPFFALLEVDAV